MTQTTESVLAGVLSTDRVSFRRLYAFNYRPADYVHATRRPLFADGQIAEAIWSEERARNHLSTYILREMELEQKPCLDVARWEWKLVLLDGERLTRLARHIGGALLGPYARRSVVREEVLRWRERLTEEVYQFVVTSASLLRVVESTEQMDPTLPVETIGYGWIQACLASAPIELQARAQLKFPVDVSTTSVPPESARQFVISVLSALEPTWCSSFVTTRQ